MKILLVEDNADFACALKEMIPEHTFYICYTLRQGMAEYQSDFDLFLIDLGLPDGDGMDLVEAVRLYSNRPVLVLTGDCQEYRMIDGYKAGIDDYIEKPVKLRVLREKINALAKNRGLAGETVEILGNCMLDTGQGLMNRTSLTRTQTELLYVLAVNPDRPVRHEELERALGKKHSWATISSRLSELKQLLAAEGLTIKGRKNEGYWLDRL